MWGHVGTRNPSRRSPVARRGTTSIQLLVILVPVVFAFMGFAVDLGRLYLIRGELNQAATAMALSAATRLIGTQDALDRANTAANYPLDDSTGHGSRYNFGAALIGQTTGLLSSEVSTPSYFTTLAGATGDPTALNDQADGTTARYVQVNIQADAPLLFWSLLSAGQSRTTPIAARAVAGLSSPVCTACGIEPFAVAALSTGDTTDFGFTAATRYTFAYQCQATPPNVPAASALASGQQVISYLLIDPTALATGGTYVDTGGLDETQALYRIGAQGLLPSTVQAQSCIRVGDPEVIWGANGGLMAAGNSCNLRPPTPAQYMLCGLYTRFASDLPTACQGGIVDADLLVAAYQPDTDLNDLDDYTAYTGNTRRVITVPIVDALSNSASTPMNVLGYRQFLVEPNPGDVATNPADQNGRFVALYLGTNPADQLTTPVPLKQGRIDGCQNGYTVAAGPGKVVLHQ